MTGDQARCTCGGEYDLKPLTPAQSRQVDPDGRPRWLLICAQCGGQVKLY